MGFTRADMDKVIELMKEIPDDGAKHVVTMPSRGVYEAFLSAWETERPYWVMFRRIELKVNGWRGA